MAVAGLLVWLIIVALAAVFVHRRARSIERTANSSTQRESRVQTADIQTEERRIKMAETPQPPQPEPQAPEPQAPEPVSEPEPFLVSPPAPELVPAAEPASASEVVPEPVAVSEPAPVQESLPEPVPLPEFPMPAVSAPEGAGEEPVALSPESSSPLEEARRLFDRLRSSSDEGFRQMAVEWEALTNLQKLISNRKRFLRTELGRMLNQSRGTHK